MSLPMGVETESVNGVPPPPPSELNDLDIRGDGEKKLSFEQLVDQYKQHLAQVQQQQQQEQKPTSNDDDNTEETFEVVEESVEIDDGISNVSSPQENPVDCAVQQTEWCHGRNCTVCRYWLQQRKHAYSFIPTLSEPKKKTTVKKIVTKKVKIPVVPPEPHFSEPDLFQSIGSRLHNMEDALKTTKSYTVEVAEWTKAVATRHGGEVLQMKEHEARLDQQHDRMSWRVKLLEDQLGELLADFSLQKRAFTELVVTVFLLSLVSSVAILAIVVSRLCCGPNPATTASSPSAVTSSIPTATTPMLRRGRTPTPRAYTPSVV